VSNAPSVDIATLLNDNGFGSLGTDLFAMTWGTNSSQQINKQILVMDTSGFDSNLRLEFEQPGFQILTRGDKRESPKDVYDRARAVHIFLINQPDLLTINGVDYLGFEPIGNLAPLGKDENERFIFTMNYFTFRNPE